MTEYIEFCNINTMSDVAKAIAPPDPPSPIITLIVGISAFRQVKIDDAIDSDCPLSSASLPGKAPAVSTKVTTGNENFSANLETLVILDISNSAKVMSRTFNF